MTAPEIAPAASIHMIAFEKHADAIRFLGEMQAVATSLSPDASLRISVVATVADFKAALCMQADLVIVSAHGQAYKRGLPFIPGLGDRPVGTNWLRLSESGCGSGVTIGARAGIFWDVCNAGRPGFREELEPLLGHQIVHIGVIGQIYYDDSVTIGTEILTRLFAVRSVPVTAESVAAAAEKAITVTGLRLYWTWLGRAEAT
jgi:hypothetical protein